MTKTFETVTRIAFRDPDEANVEVVTPSPPAAESEFHPK
jgi:hypothetical protein